MKTFWDKIAFAYDAAESLNKKTYNQMLAGVAANVPEGAAVLECAAGTGAISIAVARKAKSVLCSDLSLPMLERARKKAEKAGVTNVTFAARDIFALPERDGSFDVVIAANVVHLLDRPHDALKELWRVTKSGGALIVPTFLTRGSEKGFLLLIRLYRLVGFRPAHNFTGEQYAQMLAQSGLPDPRLDILPGRVPVGFAVFRKD